MWPNQNITNFKPHKLYTLYSNADEPWHICTHSKPTQVHCGAVRLQYVHPIHTLQVINIQDLLDLERKTRGRQLHLANHFGPKRAFFGCKKKTVRRDGDLTWPPDHHCICRHHTLHANGFNHSPFLPFLLFYARISRNKHTLKVALSMYRSVIIATSKETEQHIHHMKGNTEHNLTYVTQNTFQEHRNILHNVMIC